MIIIIKLCAKSEKRPWSNKYKANKWRELFGAKHEVINRIHKSKRPAEVLYTRVSIGAPLARLDSIPPTQGSVLVHRWHGLAVSRLHRGQSWYTAGTAWQYPTNTEAQLSTRIEYIYKSSYRKYNKK